MPLCNTFISIVWFLLLLSVLLYAISIQALFSFWWDFPTKNIYGRNVFNFADADAWIKTVWNVGEDYIYNEAIFYIRYSHSIKWLKLKVPLDSSTTTIRILVILFKATSVAFILALLPVPIYLCNYILIVT
jgi:hypothetical protein